MSENKSMKTETNSGVNEVGDQRLVLPLTDRLNSLSTNAKAWLEKTCERFADSQGYDKNADAINECVEAGLIRKRRYYVEVDGDVMDAVYSNDFFGQNDQGHTPTK